MDNAYAKGQHALCGDYSAYTPTGLSYFRKAGRAHTTPKRGDVVYFYSSSLGRVSHVGIVVDVSLQGKTYTIKTIEGNTKAGTRFERDGGEAAYKTYTFTEAQVGGKNLLNAFCSPLYDGVTTSELVIKTAKKWVGYVEKDLAALNCTDEQLQDHDYMPGDDNVTWFGRWYGRDHGSVYFTGQWCQMFVSWCFYEAAREGYAQQFTGWTQENGKWYYRMNGQIQKSKWLEISGRWYVFADDGSMITGWFRGADGWYYLNRDDGAMLASQWIRDDGSDYYLTKSGLMATSCYVKAYHKDHYYWVGSGGEWVPEKDTAIPADGEYIIEE